MNPSLGHGSESLDMGGWQTLAEVEWTLTHESASVGLQADEISATDEKAFPLLCYDNHGTCREQVDAAVSVSVPLTAKTRCPLPTPTAHRQPANFSARPCPACVRTGFSPIQTRFISSLF